MSAQGQRNERPLKDFRVLVVENEYLIGLDIEATLREAGAEVFGPFAELPPACEVAANGPVSAAILDFRLGAVTTHEVAEILASRAIPFVYYTGQALPEGTPPGPVILKPASRHAIITALMTAVRGGP